MKKLLITLIALASFYSMNAQEDEIRLGAKGGLNISNLTGDDVGNVDSKIGFHIGAVVEIPLSDKFAFQPELLFSTQGAKTEFSGVDFTSSLLYINIPLMAKYYIAEGFSLQAGPQIGILASAKSKIEGDGIDEEEDLENLKTIDFGINFGAGYQLESGIFFDARYNLGLTTIDDDLDAKNAVIQISVGYKF